jgi:glycosyltransferase involved in cell wall biosynthesis
MKRKDPKITIAFDIKRLADSFQYNWQNFGITRYTRNLYDQLTHAERAIVEPVVFANADEQFTSKLDNAVSGIQANMGKEVSRNWERRNPLPGTFLALHLLGHIHQARRLLDPLERKLDRLVYDRIPFPNRLGWDIYHSPINPLPSAQWIGKATRVLTVHDLLDLKFPKWYPKETNISKVINSIDGERDYVVCDSDCTRRDLMSLAPIDIEHTCVIPLAGEVVFAHPCRERARSLLRIENIVSERYVLALAQNDPRKNISRLAQAFRTIKDAPMFSDCVLVLVAARSQRTFLLEQLQATGLPESFFKIVVDIDNETLSGLYACAALFAYVSLYEGFGIPVLEAMSAGCPVVVSNTSSFPEIAGEAGFYVDPESVEDIAAGLSQVLGSESLRKSMNVKGIKRAEEFSWGKTAAMTLDFYERILRTRNLNHGT